MIVEEDSVDLEWISVWNKIRRAITTTTYRSVPSAVLSGDGAEGNRDAEVGIDSTSLSGVVPGILEDVDRDNGISALVDAGIPV